MCHRLIYEPDETSGSLLTDGTGKTIAMSPLMRKIVAYDTKAFLLIDRCFEVVLA
jgi:hypothetical protein